MIGADAGVGVAGAKCEFTLPCPESIRIDGKGCVGLVTLRGIGLFGAAAVGCGRLGMNDRRRSSIHNHGGLSPKHPCPLHATLGSQGRPNSTNLFRFEMRRLRRTHERSRDI